MRTCTRSSNALVKHCNECGVDCNGVYLDREETEGAGFINAWAAALRKCPQLACKCRTFGKFGGYSICRLLEVQPQLAKKFSIEALRDYDSDCWLSYSERWFNFGWHRLVAAQPQFRRKADDFPFAMEDPPGMKYYVLHGSQVEGRGSIREETVNAGRGRKFQVEYSLALITCLTSPLPEVATYEDIIFAEAVELLVNLRRRKLDEWEMAGMLACMGARWGEVLLMLCALADHSLDIIGGDKCCSFVDAVEWIEENHPGTVRTAKDKFGNNALVSACASWIQNIKNCSPSESMADLFGRNIDCLKRLGCDPAEKNDAGVSAGMLLGLANSRK